MVMRTMAPTTPAKLRVLSVGLVLASLAWGVLGGWTVSTHASAASDIVHAEQPLTLAAQDMYEKVSDADVTATTTFLTATEGPEPPLIQQQQFNQLRQYQDDIAEAAADLTTLKSAASGNPQLTAALGIFAAGLPVYSGYVAQALTENAAGYPLTGGSFMQVASEEAHLVLLPAAKTIYTLQSATLTGASGEATSLPPLIVAGVLALIIAFALIRAQRWLAGRTNRVFNWGLVAASAALVISALWLAATFSVARSDLVRGINDGSVPAGTLAQASIDVQQVRGDEVLNLISRTGNSFKQNSFEQNSKFVRGQIGPGSGTLLDTAASSGSGQAAVQVAVAKQDATSWYAANDQVYKVDKVSNYAHETGLVIGTGRGSSAAGFARLETDIGNAISDDLGTFAASATAGANAFGPLEGVVIAASLLMAIGCAWGLNRRLREYQ